MSHVSLTIFFEHIFAYSTSRFSYTSGMQRPLSCMYSQMTLILGTASQILRSPTPTPGTRNHFRNFKIVPLVLTRLLHASDKQPQ